MSQGIVWPDKYPWRLLPRNGTHPFVPPKRADWLKNPALGPHGGYIDAKGNIWRPHHPISGREEELHWDVQHPHGGYTNVGLDGEVHHGEDNFP